MQTQVRVKKATKGFGINVRSRHPSHDILRVNLERLPFRTVVRLGSTWEGDGKQRIECNSVQSVKNSSNKLLMKQCFSREGVKTADWFTIRGNNTSEFRNESYKGNNPPDSIVQINNLPYPIVAKSHFGSRGEGNFLLKTQDELEAWMVGKTMSNYIFEKFYNYNREYRLHVTDEGVFYTCRKMLKEGTPDDKRWFRNDSNSVWIVEDNPQFDKPVNWDLIVLDAVKALEAVGLDVGAIDVKVQSTNDPKNRKREKPEWIIIEVNSAPSFGDITSEKYLTEIPKILKRKFVESK